MAFSKRSVRHEQQYVWLHLVFITSSGGKESVHIMHDSCSSVCLARGAVGVVVDDGTAGVRGSRALSGLRDESDEENEEKPRPKGNNSPRPVAWSSISSLCNRNAISASEAVPVLAASIPVAGAAVALLTRRTSDSRLVDEDDEEEDGLASNRNSSLVSSIWSSI